MEKVNWFQGMSDEEYALYVMYCGKMWLNAVPQDQTFDENVPAQEIADLIEEFETYEDDVPDMEYPQ